MHRFLFAALLTLAGAGALLAGARPASAQTYTCTCDRYCDIANGTATAGTVVRGVSRDRLRTEFGLTRAGASVRTGWRCEVAREPRIPLPERLAQEATPFYMRITDAPLALHADGGSRPGAPGTLHPCPFPANHPNCQWILEASPTTRGAYYVRSLGGALYLHAHGGATRGANLTLHACPKNADHPNCQWLFEPSPSRQGAFYLRSKGGALYAHIHGGSSAGARGTLHPCPKSSDHPNCQWRLGLPVH